MSAPRRSGRHRVIQPLVASVVAALVLTACAVTQVDLIWPMSGSIGAPDSTIVLAAPPEGREAAARIAILGDVGTGEADEWATAGLVAAAAEVDPFDALVLLGDNVYPNGDPSRLNATVFGPFGPVLDRGAELLAVLGNHDVRDGNALGQVAALGMGGRWYAAEVGPALLVMLDSTMVDDTGQLTWLQSTLASAQSEWIIVAMHHPPYSAGSHGSDKDVREAWTPLFKQYGVDVVLSGHDHDYQRTVPIDGITYIVSGGGADIRLTDRADFTAFAGSVLHYVDITIWAGRLEVTAFSAAGPFDHLTLDKTGAVVAALIP